MKKFWLAAAAALLVTAILPDGAFAQRGGFHVHHEGSRDPALPMALGRGSRV
jgi:hypothetical protein